jgi:hypothetical protein
MGLPMKRLQVADRARHAKAVVIPVRHGSVFMDLHHRQFLQKPHAERRHANQILSAAAVRG